jgi:pimeloyl-ACP methyl ester carboxylesterase
MSTFALVHGAWLGAWCWERLTPELESLGHRVITMDLPCDDGSATFDDYADVVCEALDDIPGTDLIVVGHSLGGLTIARVAARRPVRHLVYLCAIPPLPGHSLTEQIADDKEMLNPDYLKGIGDMDPDGRRPWIDRDLAIRILFGDCDDASATWAFARFRPQGTYGYGLPFSSALPSVDSTYVLCADDCMVNPSWSRKIAPERLQADVVELPGSHSPFLSRPRELAELLHGLA